MSKTEITTSDRPEIDPATVSPERAQFAQVPTYRKPSNPKKGRRHHSAARDFLKKYAIGDTLSWEEYCTWAKEHGLFEGDIPPAEIQATQDDVPLYDEHGNPITVSNKQSDEWLAYLQRRHQARVNHNKAAEHDEMNTCGGAYTIAPVDGNTVAIKSVRSVFLDNKAAEQIDRFIKTKRRKLAYLFQSTDWSQVKPYERLFAENLMEEIDEWGDEISNRQKKLEGRFNRLRLRLEQQVNAGEIVPTNHALEHFIKEDEDDD